jgi:hypothetical protein
MKFFLSTAVGVIIFLLFTPLLYAATIHVEPAASTVKLGTTVNMQIKADTLNDPLSAVEAYVVFDPTFFDVSIPSITYGSLFTKKEAQFSGDTLMITAMQEDPKVIVPFTGTVATIPFTPKKTGKTSILLYCDETQNRSTKIFKKDAHFSNILDCSATGNNHRLDVTVTEPDVLGANTQQLPKQNTNNVYSIQLVALIGAFITGVTLFGISFKRFKS